MGPEPSSWNAAREPPNGAGDLLDDVPLDRSFEQRAQDREDVVDRLRGRAAEGLLSRCTSSLVMASSRVAPNAGTRCTRSSVSLFATVLGFWRFARAYRSTNRAPSYRHPVVSAAPGTGLPQTC